ncbi:LacI family DNA-binding transcriptional regulator [Frankia sp. AgB1.9]|uniref:LacI family DNA-binding transcriptional regulator n=1 Tax=unclassified Frankia TaxID=2632575 RepID=UPI0019321EA2|nr:MULTISPECIES: LacI family DNA-binding transcriptional regulator [unclassified Frankia]MBL7489780.1 LacI family DNA-binding transcriptional regulator [Frankia sp. AgW1.1]MBL7552617.1 LacI family DNA-binding transcriptional regulator [Frankia sp. AgB1.9]MBL7623705.1 LacI family DNA-binding transcriptional regulator [Frankia sp. AgB1.8]
MDGSDENRRRRVTGADVAREAGVSRTTVGYVLNATPGQTISASTRERVLAAADRLHYRPNNAARALATGQSRIILVVLADWPVAFRFRDFLDEASRVLAQAGYALITYTHRPGTEGRPLWESMNPDLVVASAPLDSTEVATMRACGIKTISPDPDHPLAVKAGPDLQVNHLHARGHRQMIYAAFVEPRMSTLIDARYQAACAQAGILGLPQPDLAPIAYSDGSAAATVQRWHDTGITAVIAFNDDVAAAVAGGATRAGLGLPEDLAVVGHDDAPIATTNVPALSTVQIDTPTLGREFAESALHELDGRPLPAPEWNTTANFTLIPRQTT